MSKKIDKIISFIFISLFIIIFSYYNFWEYNKFYKIHQNQIISKKEVLNDALKFSLKDIKEYKNIDFYNTPNKQLIDNLVNKIKNAKKRIYVEVYILTEKRLEKALVNARKNNKNLDIKVILEKNPYMAPWLNRKAYDFLIKNNINVVYSNTNNFSLNHTKMILIDDIVFLSTWNFTYSSFVYNREFMLFIKNESLLKSLNQIFLWDFYWKLVYIYNTNLVLSPVYSRIKIEKILNQAKNDIKMYFPYLDDKELTKILINKSKQWLNIKLITWKDSEKHKDEINILEKNNIKIKILKKPKLHAKSILIDNKYLYIWSINFSRYSLDKNREIWIIFKNSNIIDKFNKVFKNDFLN